MARLPDPDLNYGHFGQAVYDTEAKEWLFSRRAGRRQELKPLGTANRLLPASLHVENAPSSDHAPPTRTLLNRTRDLIRDLPELAPAIELLPEESKLSAAVTSSIATYDPALGDLLSFGSTSSKHGKRISLAAVPEGEGGEMLRLIRVSREQMGWSRDQGVAEDDKSIWLEAPTFLEESGSWIGEGSPIQQVCFAYSEDRYTLLAVRLPNKTVILRPAYTDASVPPKRSRFCTLSASRIDLLPIVDIGTPQTGGHPHSHVTFNPWYQRQVAIVDTRGYWSVRDINDGRYWRHNNHTTSLSNYGSIKGEDGNTEESESSEPRGDGWARTLWIGDVNTLLVCNRRRMEVLDIRGEAGKPSRLACPELISARTSEWILDVKTSLHNPRHFFALTSSRLLFLEVRCIDDLIGYSDETAGVSLLLSWRHYRNSEDVTLQLSVMESSEEESLVLVWSRLNELVTAFRYSSMTDDLSFPMSDSDPTELDFPSNLFKTGGALKHIKSLHVNRLHFGEDSNPYGLGDGARYMKEGISFYKLTICLSDLSVHDVLYYALNPTARIMRTITGEPGPVQPLSWREKGIGAHSRILTSKLIGDDDGFIVPDGSFAASLSSSPRARRSAKHSKATLRRRTSSSSVGSTKDTSYDPWTVSNELLYGHVARPILEILSGKGEDEFQQKVTKLTDLFKGLMEASAEELVHQGTLYELDPSSVYIGDPDKASCQLHNLFHSAQESNASEPHRVASKIALESVLQLDGSESQESTISSVYDHVMKQWITSLPQDIYFDLRRAKERLSRQIAAEMILASARIRVVEPSPETVPDTQTDTSQPDSVNLPILGSREGKERDADPFTNPLSQSLRYATPEGRAALPTPEATPSLVSGTTFTSSFSIEGDPHMNSLRHHVITAKPTNLLSPSIVQVLMHWKHYMSRDPNTYNWDAATREVREELHLDEDGMSTSRRARLQRKAERHLKRQRRETAAVAAKEASSQPLLLQELGQMRSSPGPSMRGLQSSQPTQGFTQFGGVASQGERGNFGARPTKKVKKTKVPGFR